ncbi:MAG: zeta toxin family protein [Proteobacteria bacterium]|nr:zeta toxin family protein [Pseudomonadota bacterium]
MARPSLSERDAERIYLQQIRPDHFDESVRSATPTAVLIGGQPGAGKAYALARVQAHLTASVGPSVAVSADLLREYHPQWRQALPSDLRAYDAIRPDIGRWYVRLTADAIAAGLNVVLVSTMRDLRGVHALSMQLRAASYQLSAVVLATDRDQSRQATLARYDLARAAGLTPAFVPGAVHDSAYAELRDVLGQLESAHLVDRLQVVARDGRQLYANHWDAERWAREPKAVAVLDDYRERRKTARELADAVLRWQTLATRLATDPGVPREVASLATAWGQEAASRIEQDTEAARLVRWGKEAEAFRTLPRTQFEREFPQHTKALERLDEAIRFAGKDIALEADRERFVAQSRARIAERIAEGRYTTAERVKEREAKAR